jgi:hypothetical protein
VFADDFGLGSQGVTDKVDGSSVAVVGTLGMVAVCVMSVDPYVGVSSGAAYTRGVRSLRAGLAYHWMRAETAPWGSFSAGRI